MVSCKMSQYCASEHSQREGRYICLLQMITSGSKSWHIIIHSSKRFVCLKCAIEQSGNEGCIELVDYHLIWCAELDEQRKVPRLETHRAFVKQLQKVSWWNIILWSALQKQMRQIPTSRSHGSQEMLMFNERVSARSWGPEQNVAEVSKTFLCFITLLPEIWKRKYYTFMLQAYSRNLVRKTYRNE